MKIKGQFIRVFFLLYVSSFLSCLQASPLIKRMHQFFDGFSGFGVPATDPELDIFAKEFPIDAPLSHTGKTLLTYNRFGFDVLDSATADESWLISAIVEFSKNAQHPLIDIGGGYGRLTRLLLEEGGKVIYNEIDVHHLMYGFQQVSTSDHQNLYLNNKRFPDQTDFPDESLSGVILHRVIHFLTPEEIEAGFKKIARWLVPGGKIFIAVLPPHHGEYRQKVLPAYDKAWKEGNPWPGHSWSSYEILPEQAYGLPKKLHVMDHRPLKLALEKCGFVVERYDFVSMKKFAAPTPLRDGKELFGLVARKG